MGSPQRSYTPEDRERAMLALVLHAGSGTQARRFLQAQGLDIPAETLNYWRRQHPQRYEEMRVEVAPKVVSKIASEAEELAVQSAQLERELLERLSSVVHKMEPRDVSQAVRNVAIAKGIQIDKSGALRGRPGVIVEQRSPTHVLEVIAKKLGWVEGTATDISKQLPKPKENKKKSGG